MQIRDRLHRLRKLRAGVVASPASHDDATFAFVLAALSAVSVVKVIERRQQGELSARIDLVEKHRKPVAPMASSVLFAVQLRPLPASVAAALAAALFFRWAPVENAAHFFLASGFSSCTIALVRRFRLAPSL